MIEVIGASFGRTGRLHFIHSGHPDPAEHDLYPVRHTQVGQSKQHSRSSCRSKAGLSELGVRP